MTVAVQLIHVLTIFIYEGSVVAKCDPLLDPDALIIVALNPHLL